MSKDIQPLKNFVGYWTDKAKTMGKYEILLTENESKCLTRAIRRIGKKARQEKQGNKFVVWKI